MLNISQKDITLGTYGSIFNILSHITPTSQTGGVEVESLVEPSKLGYGQSAFTQFLHFPSDDIPIIPLLQTFGQRDPKCASFLRTVIVVSRENPCLEKRSYLFPSTPISSRK